MNSAERLHSLLSAAMKINGGPTRHAWARVLEVEKDDTVAVLAGVGQILELVNQVEGDVCGLALDTHDTNLSLDDLRKIRDAFHSFHLEEAWHQAKRRFDVGAIRGLLYMASGLRKAATSDDVTPDDVPPDVLAELTKQVESVIADVVKADIDLALKLSIHRHLEFARRALLDYHIRGPEGLQEAVDLNLGLIVRHRGTAKLSSSVRSAFAQTWSLLEKLNTAISLAGHGTQLTPPVVSLLGEITKVGAGS